MGKIIQFPIQKDPWLDDDPEEEPDDNLEPEEPEQKVSGIWFWIGVALGISLF